MHSAYLKTETPKGHTIHVKQGAAERAQGIQYLRQLIPNIAENKVMTGDGFHLRKETRRAQVSNWEAQWLSCMAFGTTRVLDWIHAYKLKGLGVVTAACYEGHLPKLNSPPRLS
jgi:hypothetical protein